MKLNRRTTAIISLAGSLLLAGVASAQDAESTVPVLSLKDLKLEYYAVKHVPTVQLAETVSNTVGRHFYVAERGGRQAGAVANLQILGDSLVVYDLEEDVNRILTACATLDQPGSSGTESVPLETLEYSPRYVSLDTLSDVLKPFERSLDPDGNRNTRARNINWVKDRNLVLVHETPERMANLQAAIVKIDRPERQVLVTCRLLRTVPASDEEGLPKPLVENLRELVPEYRFESAGFAMLRTGVSPRQDVKLRLGDYFVLEFRPVAFDSKTHALTVERCRLKRIYNQSARSEDGSPLTETVFETRAILRGGEYTVLGASGSELPLFVVVEVAPLDSAH